MTPPPAPEPPPGPPPPGPAGVAWTTAVIALATALLLLFNAQSPRSWTAQLPPSEAALAAHDLAERWWRVTARLGLAAPRAALTRQWDALQAARFARAPEGVDQR